MLSHSFASIYSLCPPFSRSPPPHRSRRCRSTFFELRIQSRFEHVVSAFSPLVLPARMFFFFFVFYLFFLLLLRRWWPRVYRFALGGEERFRRIIGAEDFWQDRPNCFLDRSVTAFPFRCLVTEEEVIFFFFFEGVAFLYCCDWSWTVLVEIKIRLWVLDVISLTSLAEFYLASRKLKRKKFWKLLRKKVLKIVSRGRPYCRRDSRSPASLFVSPTWFSHYVIS